MNFKDEKQLPKKLYKNYFENYLVTDFCSELNFESMPFDEYFHTKPTLLKIHLLQEELSPGQKLEKIWLSNFYIFKLKLPFETMSDRQSNVSQSSTASFVKPFV